MTARAFWSRYRVGIIAGAVLLGAVLLFWRPLAGWFSGDGGGEGAPGADHAGHGGADTAGADTAGADPAGPDPASTEPVLPAVELSPPALAAAQQAITAYDAVRERLANDQLDGVSAHAGEVADALRAAAAAEPNAPAPLADALASGARAADELAATTALDPARRAFGELSRWVVAIARAESRLQEGRHLFRCTMADGYENWIQASADKLNPYMGQEMPTCGAEADWQGPAAGAGAAASGAPISHEGHGHAGDDVAFHTCPMHPSVKQKTAGACPICGMDLEPVTWEEHESGVVLIDQERRRRMGVVTGHVKRAPMTTTVRAAGRLTYDETRLVDVTLKLKGWIAQLHVDETGQAVRKGQPLLDLYSPELYAAQQEYLLALRSQQAAARAGTSARSGYLVRAAEKKLRLWDLSSAQIARIARRGEPIEEIPVLSPASGFVIEKEVVQGTAIEPGQRVFRIAALDSIWVEAQVYEADLARVEIGQQARVTLDYLPGRVFEGKVTHVFPFLDPETRTGRVRVELPNPKLELRPDMFATVELEVDLGERLQVPMSAVLYTGPRRLVFVDLGEGRLRPQEVVLGARAGDAAEVLSGLEEGQAVVTSGNFLVAAESRLRSAAEYWGGGEEPAPADPATGTTAPTGGAGGGHEGH